MKRKINVYVNGKYEYSTNRFQTCKAAIKEARQTKHLYIESIPPRYITIYDYDKLTARYAD